MLQISDVTQYVENHIGEFHQKRLARLEQLQLKNVLKSKNPYLFKAKDVSTAEEVVRAIVDAHLSSSEETIFGDWLEGLAIFICCKAYGGRKSTTKGIDLEFDKDGVRQIVSIKSGPNWGNSSQINKMQDNFRAAERSLKTGNSKLRVDAVNGCCYGQDDNPEKDGYQKLCGQRFWEYISGDSDLFTKIIEPLGREAKQRNQGFRQSYAKVINKFTQEFGKDFIDTNGAIDWEALLRFNSAKQ